MERSDWIKHYERVIDQRHEALPPAWVARERREAVGAEVGTAVHISGRQRQVVSRIVSLLGTAQDVAVVSSFLLADEGVEEALMATARRGVRVYVMLASEARLGREESDGEFDRRVIAQHKGLLQKLAGHVLFRSAPHFHAKVVVVDPQTAPRGILLTANLTREALERNEELAVELTAAEAREAAALLGWAMWETAEHEMIDPSDRFRAVKPMGSLYPPPRGTRLLATTPERTELRAQALHLIASAQERLMVASFGWDAGHPVVQQICARARAGVEVTVLARIRPAAMPALLRLREAGATVYGFRWLHAKAIWADGQALMMSANLQGDGLDRGFELGVCLEGARAAELKGRLDAWAASAPWTLEHTLTVGAVRGKAKLWHQDVLTEVDIAERISVDLGTHTADSADELSVVAPPLPSGGPLPRMAHEVVCSWVVSAPMLDRKAKEVLQPNPQGKPQPYRPPVFTDRSGKQLIAVRQPGELAEARRLRARLSAAAIVVQGDAR